ncbi:MAG: hypothetical protein CMJ76_14070 [Planctomycetaceae bacterium]|nr:hypothetical protein [Planctomycetaceae bacterium]
MLSKNSLLTLFLLVTCSSLMGQNNISANNAPQFFQFDLKSKSKRQAIQQPELILPNGNSYAVRIESDLSVDISGVTENFIAKVDAAIGDIIDSVTGDHIDGRVLLEQRGFKFDPLYIANSNDIFLQQYTPIIGGQSSNITNYHLIAIVDFKPMQTEISHVWGEIMLGERLIQYIMIASIVLIILFTLRGNQVMRNRDTHPTIRIFINVVILVTILVSLAVIGTMLHWV